MTFLQFFGYFFLSSVLFKILNTTLGVILRKNPFILRYFAKEYPQQIDGILMESKPEPIEIITTINIANYEGLILDKIKQTDFISRELYPSTESVFDSFAKEYEKQCQNKDLQVIAIFDTLENLNKAKTAHIKLHEGRQGIPSLDFILEKELNQLGIHTGSKKHRFYVGSKLYFLPKKLISIIDHSFYTD